MLHALPDREPPAVAASAWVAPSADVIGCVTLEEEASVWFNAVLRGDNEPIVLGRRANVQDCSVLHTDPGCPLVLEDNVSVGHSAMLHGCTIRAGSLVGIGSTVLNNAVIGRRCMVGAHTLVPENKTFPDGTLILGTPGRVVRELTDDEIAGLAAIAESYVGKIARYRGMTTAGG